MAYEEKPKKTGILSKLKNLEKAWEEKESKSQS